MQKLSQPSQGQGIPNIRVVRQTVQAGEHRQMDRQTNGRYQIYYLTASQSININQQPAF